MEQEGAPLLPGDVIQALLVMDGPQRHRHQGLRLAPVEQGRAVGAGQQPDLGADRPDFRRGTTVDSPVLLEDHLPKNAPFERFDDLQNLGLEGGIFGRQDLNGVFPDLIEPRIPLHLARHAVPLLKPRQDRFGNPCGQGLVFLNHRLGPFGLARLPAHPVLKVDHGAHLFEAEIDRIDDDILGNLFRPSFHHDQVHVIGTALRARNDLAPHQKEVEIALFLKPLRGIADKGALHATDADPGNGPLEGDVRNLEGGGGRQHRRHVGIVLVVERKDRRHDLGLVEIVFWEQGTDGTVDDPRCQDLLLVEPTLPLEKAAGNLPRGIRHFLVIHGQGKEIDPLPDRLQRNGGHQNHRLPVCRQDGAVRLPCDIIRLEGDTPPRKIRTEQFAHTFLSMVILRRRA